LPIFCAQNGVANEGIAARYFQQVNGVMVLIGAKRLGPGEVVHTGNGPWGLVPIPQG
jgi:2-dehydropantoate 2-reductase